MSREDLIGFKKEIAKCFVSGLKPDIFREEIYSRTFENLDDVIRESREESSIYLNILDISDSVKKSEPKQDFGKGKRDYARSVTTFPKKNEANSTSAATFILMRNLVHSVQKMT